uniref:Discoidin, CUB and LCCL domain containing 2 n=1 Tax=Astyanax mexicanus TaxID=7994 RepID=A0A8B9GQ53_ASTMX
FLHKIEVLLLLLFDAQISASSVWEWARHGEKPSVWASSGSRLKRAGLPWAAVTSDTKQWIQVDLKREKKITGIITTGSSLPEYQFYVSAYRVQYSSDGQDWTAYKDSGSNQQKVFQGNTNYLHEVRNNFIPPIEARFIRINPYQWHQRIALKMELLNAKCICLIDQFSVCVCVCVLQRWRWWQCWFLCWWWFSLLQYWL